MVSYKLCLLCKKHHCQKDGWCLQKGIFLQNEGHEKSMSAHYQLFLSLQGYTLSLVKLVQWWKFGFYKIILLFGASRFRLCPTILYPSKFLVPIHFVGFFQCPPFCVYKGGVWPHGANFNGDLLLSFNLTTSKTRSNSARLPQCLNLTTSKTKQFCETSFKNGKLSAALGASYQCVLRFFHSTCVKYCACPEKLMPGHTKCCTRHAKSSQQTWRSDTPKCNPSQEMSALTPEHLWWTCLLYCTCHANASFKILFKCPTPAIVSGNAAKPSRFAHFWQGAQSFAPATQNDIWTS